MSEVNKDKKVITISREYGSGGRIIGKKLAEKLGVPYYDRDTINDRISEESGFAKEMFSGAEQKAKNSFLYSLASAMGSGEAGPESLSLNERLFLAQFDAIRKIAEEGSCVIVGRCADYILRGLPYATNIFIYAEEEDKIRRAVEVYGDSEDQVRKIMRAADKSRANYYAYHTGRKWGEHVNFNLCIDSGYLEVDDIVDLIIEYTNRQIWRKTTIDEE
ncbi:MAG: cytidylate kinase-like family protein [Clostridia bacterium]|nr:cytidylate kinase-like family protein [Clostridia bacterium]